MSYASKESRDSIVRQRQRSRLDESGFIRTRLFAGERSAFARYTDLAFRSFSWPKLIRYELLMMFIGPMPGALGLVLRKRLFRSLFRTTGKGVIFGQNLTLRHADRITLGDGVVLDRDCLLDARGAGNTGIVIGDRVIVSHGAAIQAKAGSIEIGADCNIGSHVSIVAQGAIIIEDNVSIAGKATIAGGRHIVELDGSDPEHPSRFTCGSIRLRRNARIGMGAIVQDGVTVGENSIVAPGAVVFESVAPSTVVWGNPARPVRDRTAAETPALKMRRTRPVSAAFGSESDDAVIRQQVSGYLNEDLFIEFGPGDFSPADSLIDAGILDSLALVRLSLWIEQHFGVEIDFATLDSSAIDSLEKIVDYISRRIQ